MTRLPKGWRGLKDVRGVYVKTKSLYQVERDVYAKWRGYHCGDCLHPRTIGYDRAIDAMNAVDRLIKEEPAPLVTHHTDDGQIVVTRDTSGT